MPFGIGNPTDVDSSSSVRPSHINSGVNERRWFTTGATLSAEDVNAIWAQIRAVGDFYGVADVEGDDTYLQQIFAKFVPTTGGTMTGVLNANSGVGIIGTNIQQNLFASGGSNAAYWRAISNPNPATIALRKSRGSIASPVFPNANDQVGEIIGQINDGTTQADVASIRFVVTEATPGAAAAGGRALLAASPIGSVTLTEMVRAEHATGLSMFGANPVIDQNRHHRLRSYTIGTLPSASPAGQVIFISDMGTTGALAFSNGTIWLPYCSGTYTPTLTNISNVSSSTVHLAQYLRAGNTVTVGGQVNITPTAAVFTEFTLTIPFASNFVNADGIELGGAGAVSGNPPTLAHVAGGNTNNNALFHFVAPGTTPQKLSYSYTYQVLP